jgi:ribosome maturation factor RimP
MDNDSIVSQVWELATPLVADEGLEIFDIEFRREGRGGWVLRLYLDKEGGPNLDDLTRVSRQLGDLLDVHNLPQRAYTLEVSSPGVNRLLKRPEHFTRFLGKKIRVRTRDRVEGRRTFLGLLKETTQDGIVVSQEKVEVYIPHGMIEKANYEHEWDRKG